MESLGLLRRWPKDFGSAEYALTKRMQSFLVEVTQLDHNLVQVNVI